MRHLILIRLTAYIFLLGALPANADSAKSTWDGPALPVYVVTQNHYAEGVTPEGDTAQFSDLIMIQIYSGQDKAEQSGDSYPINSQVNLFFHGEKRGSVTIKKVAPLQCDSTAAIVSAPQEIKFKKGSMALASNAPTFHSHVDWSTQADASTNSYARSLAAGELKRHGISVENIEKIKIDRLIVTYVEKGGPRVLIGALSYLDNGVEHDLFIIGQIEHSKAILGFVRYHDMKDLVDNTDIDRTSFVDQLDLDGDGVDEIVLEETGYEDERFEILKRQDGNWTQVWDGGEGGC